MILKEGPFSTLYNKTLDTIKNIRDMSKSEREKALQNIEADAIEYNDSETQKFIKKVNDKQLTDVYSAYSSLRDTNSNDNKEIKALEDKIDDNREKIRILQQEINNSSKISNKKGRKNKKNQKETSKSTEQQKQEVQKLRDDNRKFQKKIDNMRSLSSELRSACSVKINPVQGALFITLRTDKVPDEVKDIVSTKSDFYKNHYMENNSPLNAKFLFTFEPDKEDQESEENETENNNDQVIDQSNEIVGESIYMDMTESKVHSVKTDLICSGCGKPIGECTCSISDDLVEELDKEDNEEVEEEATEEEILMEDDDSETEDEEIVDEDDISFDEYDDEYEYDSEVHYGKKFIEGGEEYRWYEPESNVYHMDFNDWQVWSAWSGDSRFPTAYFVVDPDDGFIDWGPVESYEEARDFLESKYNDYLYSEDDIEDYDEEIEDDEIVDYDEVEESTLRSPRRRSVRTTESLDFSNKVKVRNWVNRNYPSPDKAKVEETINRIVRTRPCDERKARRIANESIGLNESKSYTTVKDVREVIDHLWDDDRVYIYMNNEYYPARIKSDYNFVLEVDDGDFEDATDYALENKRPSRRRSRRMGEAREQVKEDIGVTGTYEVYRYTVDYKADDETRKKGTLKLEDDKIVGIAPDIRDSQDAEIATEFVDVIARPGFDPDAFESTLKNMDKRIVSVELVRNATTNDAMPMSASIVESFEAGFIQPSDIGQHKVDSIDMVGNYGKDENKEEDKKDETSPEA